MSQLPRTRCFKKVARLIRRFLSKDWMLHGMFQIWKCCTTSVTCHTSSTAFCIKVDGWNDELWLCSDTPRKCLPLNYINTEKDRNAEKDLQHNLIFPPTLPVPSFKGRLTHRTEFCASRIPRVLLRWQAEKSIIRTWYWFCLLEALETHTLPRSKSVSQISSRYCRYDRTWS